MTIRVLFAILFLQASFNLKAQHTSTVDSLKNVLKIATETKERVDVLNALTDELWHNAPTQAILYSDSALRLAQSIDYPKGLSLALANKGVAYYTLGNYAEAENYYKKALSTYSGNDLSNDVNLYYINLLKKQGKYSELINFIKKILSVNDIDKADPIYLSLLASTYVELGDLKEAEKYIFPILKSSAFLNDSSFYMGFNSLIFEYLVLKSEYDSAEKILQPAFNYYKNVHDNLTLARSYIQLGLLKMTTGNVKKASESLTIALAIYDSSGYAFGIAEAKRNLGTFYSSIGENDIASQYLFDAQEIYQNQNNLNELAKTYNELSWIYIQQGSFETAREFIFKAVELGEKIVDRATQSSTYNIYGLLLARVDSLPAAYDAYNTAYEISLIVNNKQRMAAALFNMAAVMEKMDQNNPEILKNYLAAYKLDKEIGNKLGSAISEYTLGAYYIKTGKLILAENYLDISRVKLKELNAKNELLENYDFSATLYTKKKNVEQANVYLRMYIALNDSLNNERVISKLGELEVKYNLKNKEREIDFLNLEKIAIDQELSLQENTIDKQRLLIGLAVIIAIFLILLLVLSYRLLAIRKRNNEKLKILNIQVQEKNEEIMAQSEELLEANQQINIMNEGLENEVEKRTNELKQAYKELDIFFYRASHDFAGPLTTFKGLAELAKSTISDDNALHLFEKVAETSLKLEKMVNKLRSISLTGAVDLKTGVVDFEGILQRVIHKNLDNVHDKDFETTISISVPESFRSYPELIEVIFESIIENCAAYNSTENPHINIEMKSLGAGVHITISDNGDGIKEQHTKRVFDMYFRATEKSKGNGLGLYLVMKAVSKLNGELMLESKYGKGTVIDIELPEIASTS